MAPPIEIVGAGPAGLAAALTVARAGRHAVVSEQRADVGARFHDDLQGIENWTTRSDVLDELAAIGIEPTFEYQPFREGVFYDPAGREYAYASPDPLFYLVRRGAGPGTLDESLKRQALARGVEIQFRQPRFHLPQGGIVAGGPRGPDVIAVGYVFETDLADGMFGALSERLAPRGYSYLLISRGRGTVAACFFDGFHEERVYLERTVDFFREKVGLRMRNPVRFGGTGNIFLPATAQHGEILFVGEAAGFQDALWGFGIRLAILSGHLAARAMLQGAPETYDGLWRRRLGSLLRASFVNRFFYQRMGDPGYVRLMRRIGSARDTRTWLRQHYAFSLGKSLLFPLARWKVRSRRGAPACALRGCDCTWCRGHPEPRRKAPEPLASPPPAAG